MARKKAQVNTNTDIFTQIRLAESYTSLIIGIVVVIFASILITSVLKSINIVKQLSQNRQISSQKTENTQLTKKEESTVQTYSVIEGDTLKIISLKFYGSEDFWDTIVKANNISDPNNIDVGMQLKLPKINTGRQFPGDSSKITGNSYMVKANEYLWDIAVRAYGDGFKWVDIASANNLQTPDSISEGMVLKIPR